ncbi:antibiotic biosynthesis monooxygenase family protein [Shewanella scandinavica]|uniref:antibiotic biosynthesis monooxygenase family protein n=1 Tax=Shewanella scandinavica TaxID=3063538 RepID=UPI00318ABC88
MMVVIFEVVPNPGCQERYLEIAADLKSSLSEIAGFISIERFQSMVNPERLLSLSFWENEAAVQAWRRQIYHREAQTQGREQLFADYRLRVAEVVRDYGMFNRAQAPRSN